MFDYWESLCKAGKLKEVSSVVSLVNKKVPESLSYTCLHPSHKMQTKHLLGSAEGNTHFLLGFANPNFKTSAYHYKMIDPTLTDEAAEELASQLGNPTRVQQPGPEEGDTLNTNKSITKKLGAATYTIYTNRVVCKDTFSPYARELLSLSYVPMVEIEVPEVKDKDNSVVPEIVKGLAAAFADATFEEDVCRLVKDKFPVPGSVVPVTTGSGESVYAVISTDSLDFYNRIGESVGITVFDKVYKSMPLSLEGDAHPAVLLNFADNCLGIDTKLLKSYYNLI